jgi:hypothetical protein
MQFPPMNFDAMNEADIRAEVIDPLLRHLGYQSGTEFNIVRERTLRYPRMSFGRKKRTDPELKGRPDYILALQLSFCFEVRALSGRLVSSAPERPCDDVCGQ